jgi:hypothetical protein
MSKHDFIFSHRKGDRLARHLVFWIFYCTYFYIQSIPPRTFEEFFIGRTYFIALMNLLCFAPVFFTAVYIFIYYLLPHTLQKKKYFRFVMGFFLVYLAGTFINFFSATIFLHYTRFYPMTFQHQVEMSNYNTRWGMVIAIIALGIKLSKDWYLQQQQNLALFREKTRAELQSEMSRIHPQLLLRSIKSISKTHLTKMPAMILNLSELLSYSLYESDCLLVPLTNEIANLKSLLLLEQSDMENFTVLNLEINGSSTGKMIAPMIILKLVEESIAILNEVNNKPAGLEIFLNVIDFQLSCIIIASCCGPDLKWQWPSLVERTKERIKVYYQEEDFQVTWTQKEGQLDIHLDLKLYDKTSQVRLDTDNLSTMTAYEFT